jgi:hypothetical protein
VPENVSQENEEHIRKRKPQSDSFQKAKILESLVLYAKQFSQNIGHNFTDRTILLTAITGAAAI